MNEAMGTRDFEPIATTLRAATIAFFNQRGEAVSTAALRNTVDTNSRFIPRRAEILLNMYQRRGGPCDLEGLRVVDLGCGFGALSLFLAARGAKVTGVDMHESRLTVGRRVAEEFDLPAQFTTGAMQQLDFQDQSFALAIQNNSLCYVVPRDDRRRTLAEARRVLVPGGWLLIRNPNRWTLIDQFSGLPLIHLLGPDRALRIARARGHKRSRVRLTSPFEGRRELNRAGFEHVAQQPVGSRFPAFLKWFARYQHFSAQRPVDEDERQRTN